MKKLRLPAAAYAWHSGISFNFAISNYNHELNLWSLNTRLFISAVAENFNDSVMKCVKIVNSIRGQSWINLVILLLILRYDISRFNCNLRRCNIRGYFWTVGIGVKFSWNKTFPDIVSCFSKVTHVVPLSTMKFEPCALCREGEQ